MQDQYKNEVIDARRATSTLKDMQPHFDEQSSALYASFMNSDPKETEKLQFLVIHHRVLMDEQQYLLNRIDTGKLAQAELDKTEK